MSISGRNQSFGRPIDAELVEVTSALAESPIAIPSGTKGALVSVDAAAVRFRVDGVSPTAAIGHLISDGGYIELSQAELSNFEVIGTTGVQAEVFITYYK